MPKRGLIVLIVVWSALLFMPAFAPQIQRMRAPLNSKSGHWPYPPMFNEAELARLTHEHPENANFALAQFRLQNEVVNDHYWRQFDTLVNRFPDNLSVRSAKLIKATSGGLVRQAFIPLIPNLSQFDIEREKFLREWQNAAQREILVEQARVGARQAPDNGFFPWIEAMALWNRDDESALRALQRTAQRTQFNDSLMANQRALIRWREKQGPLAWDEKLASAYAILLPHYAQMRALQREVVWSGIAHYRRGDKAGAYRRWRIALEAASTMRRAQSHGPQASYIGLLVGQELQKDVWNTVAQELNPSIKNKASKDWQLGAFQELARRDGQGAIADFAARERANFQSKKINPSINMTAYDKSLGVGATSTRLSLQLPWLSRNIFWLSVAGSLGLLICLIWRRLSEQFFGSVAFSQIAFFGALWLGALALAAWVRVGPEAKMLYAMFSGDNTADAPLSWLIEVFDKPALFWGAVTATGFISIALDYGQKVSEDRRLRNQVLRENKAVPRPLVLPIITVVVWSLSFCIAFLFLGPENSEDSALFQVTWGALTMLALILTLVQIERSATLNKWRLRLAFLSAVCALIAFGLAATFGLKDNFPAFVASSILTLCGLVILLYLGTTSPNWRPQFARATATALQTLGGVATVCALALLIASLAELPTRARQNRIVDDYIARGEIDWMRSQPEFREAVGNQS